MIKEHPFLKNLLISDDGNVFIPKSGTNKEHWTSGSLHSNGYKVVRIFKKNYRVHRLVAETFIPNPENKPFIDHINRIKTDNRVENLRWVTSQENNNNTKRNRQEGKRLKDMQLKDYKREMTQKWRLSHKCSLSTATFCDYTSRHIGHGKSQHKRAS